MINQLFQKALNIQEPYYIKDVKFDESQKRLDIYIDFRKGSIFKLKLSSGKEIEGKAYDTVDKTWRHLNFFEHECFLHARVPRVKHDDGIKHVETPWEGIANGFTLLFEALMIMLCLSMPVYQASKLLGVSDDKIWRTLLEYVKRVYNLLDCRELKVIGIDETSCAKGHEYVTLFVDMINRQTVFVADGKDSSTIVDFVDMLENRNGKADSIKEVSCDMSPAFIKGVRNNLSSASITFDRFHVMKVINEAVDKVRRDEIRTDKTLKQMRYIFLKNEENLNMKERNLLENIRFSGTGKKTMRAHLIKERFRELYKAEDTKIFEKILKKWYFWATHSRLPAIIEAAKTIKNHWYGIIHWKETGLSNGVLEGINSVVQAMKARARGYANHEHFKSIILLKTGKLDFNKINSSILPT